MERIIELRPELIQALLETFAMIGVAIPIAVLLGTPLGIWLFVHAPGSIAPQPKLHAFVSGVVNMLRSFPFLILLIAIIPFTRFLVGTTVGTAAAIVPLTINAIPYFARLVEQNITQLGTGAVEASRAMGATRGQIIRNVLLVDAKPGIMVPSPSPPSASFPTRQWSDSSEVGESVTSRSATATTAMRPR